MTSRLTVFDSPLFLGFEQFERTLDRIKKTSDGYPPYNIEQIGETGLRITLAVAGFTMNDLDVEVENNQLTIRGHQAEDDDTRLYLHRGIAARQFQRSFILADGIEVDGASLDNGLLHIDMKRVEPESAARKIAIKDQNVIGQNGHSSRKAIDVEGQHNK
ncbi:Hsp20 family protein [Micavibrio aeruginosavorus]|uniref:Molecular chaperone (Small heat shock protein) n=1 Tax=Micavibrio aeruginosavorus EPB TaxID=349215 RepID=M4VEW2_9BACT|nr:Hsp20 family protein [Micavibrio aeruginosavorus]AGH97005.1 Molecular chaperone (small heat shock protein) [Micavibrio aeruginosavorus EPB]